jgi:hypothetical protein
MEPHTHGEEILPQMKRMNTDGKEPKQGIKGNAWSAEFLLVHSVRIGGGTF